MFFCSKESEFLNEFVYFFPHCLCVDDKLVEPSIFEADEQFKMVFIVGVFIQFLYFSEWEMNEPIWWFDKDLIVTQDEYDILIFALRMFTPYKFAINKDEALTFDCLVLFYR